MVGPGLRTPGALDSILTAFCLGVFECLGQGFIWDPGFGVTNVLGSGHLAFQVFTSHKRGCLALGTGQGIWNQSLS